MDQNLHVLCSVSANRHNPVWVAAILLIALNILDALFTLIYVDSGVATEANPVMRALLAVGPSAFLLAKISVVSASVYLLWRYRHHRLAVVGLFGGAAAYTLLVAYHLTMLPHLFNTLV
jgi:Domain of unknown function (DUF5658)